MNRTKGTVFFWGIVGMFFFPLLAHANSDFLSIGFLYTKSVIQKGEVQKKILAEEIRITSLKSAEYTDSPLLSSASVLKSFVEEKAFHKQSTAEESDMRALEDAQFFWERDVWEFVAEYSDRSHGVDVYLQQLALYSSSIQNKSAFFEGNVKAEKAGIQGLKSQISTQEKIFSNAIKNYQEDTATDAQIELGELQRKLVILEKEAEKNSALQKTAVKVEKALIMRQKAVEENRDALVKDVRTKLPSGLDIGAIEEE